MPGVAQPGCSAWLSARGPLTPQQLSQTPASSPHIVTVRHVQGQRGCKGHRGHLCAGQADRGHLSQIPAFSVLAGSARSYDCLHMRKQTHGRVAQGQCGWKNCRGHVCAGQANRGHLRRQALHRGAVPGRGRGAEHHASRYRVWALSFSALSTGEAGRQIGWYGFRVSRLRARPLFCPSSTRLQSLQHDRLRKQSRMLVSSSQGCKGHQREPVLQNSLPKALPWASVGIRTVCTLQVVGLSAGGRRCLGSQP